MEEFIAYIDEMVTKLQREERELVASERKDEANLIRIRENIYGICKTLFEAASKTKEGGALREDYLQKLAKFSENWRISYERAKEHDDVKKAVIEEIKLQTLEEIKNKYEGLRGE